MPEGDTIRRLADKISRRFAGEKCLRCVTRDPRLVGVDLAGASLIAADAIGKHLFIRFDNGNTLHSHLRMTGIDLPVVEVLPTTQEDRVAGHLGPDLCGPDLPDLDEVVERLQREPLAAVAAGLLDQRNVAGFGNIYAIEVPFVAGVSPNQPIGTIEGLGDLVGAGTALIRTNADRGPQNTTGRRLAAADHWIYGQRGRPCPICAITLDAWEERDSPWKRVSVWCPGCQR